MTGGAASLNTTESGIGGIQAPGMPEQPQAPAQLSVNNVKKVWGSAPVEEQPKAGSNAQGNQVEKHVESHYQGSGNLNKQATP